MRDEIARARLAGVPAEVREAMLARRVEAGLPAGTITVMARFFRILAERGEHPSAPSRASFAAACASESTLALLLRSLGSFAPGVCLAEGRALRSTCYRRRPGGSQDPDRAAPRRCRSNTEPRDWPAEWLTLLPGLRAAPIRTTTIDRHIASINRCATVLPATGLPPRLGWLLGWALARELRRGDRGPGAAGVNDRTAANYIGSLVSLGLHGGLNKAALDGLRRLQADLTARGRRLPKAKEARIEALHLRGGYAAILAAIVELRDEAEAAPGWTVAAETARATAALLAAMVNIPARTGDVSRWRLGGPATPSGNGICAGASRKPASGSR